MAQTVHKGIGFQAAAHLIAQQQNVFPRRYFLTNRLSIRCDAHAKNEAQSGVRRLILMRHAESEETRQVRDHDRPITEEGQHAARSVGRQLRDVGWLPDVLVCSNSLRSRQTLEMMREELPELENADAHFLGSLYSISQLDGETRNHLQEVVATEASGIHTCVLCLGHNKGWSEAASSFVNDEVKLGNCHAALLEGASGTWEDAFHIDATWRLIKIVIP